MSAVLQVCVALVAALSAGAVSVTPPSSIGAFTATFVPASGTSKVLYEGARRTPGSNYFGIRPDAAPSDTDCVFLAFDAAVSNYSTAGVVETSLLCHNRSHDATTFAGADSGLLFNPVIAQRSFVPSQCPAWQTPYEGWRVLPGAPLVSLRYQPANLNPGTLDLSFVLITEPVAVNPAAAVCIQEAPLTPEGFPWVPAGVLESVDCGWDGYDFETVFTRCRPSGLVLHIWNDTGGNVAYPVEVLEFQELDCTVLSGYDDAGSVRFLAAIVDNLLEEMLDGNVLNFTEPESLVALDLYIDIQVYRPPVAQTFTARMRYQMDDLGGRDLVPMDVDVTYPGGFVFASAPYLSREDDFSAVSGLISVDMVAASVPSSGGLDVSLASLFVRNEALTTARFRYDYFTLHEPLQAQWNYTGAFALRPMDYWSFYDYYANLDLGWPSFQTQEFCAALDPALMTDFGLLAGYKLLDPAVASGASPVSVLSADAMRVRRLFQSVAYVLNGDDVVYCQYALLPVAASDMGAPGVQPGVGGSALDMRPLVVVRVAFGGSLDSYYNIQTFYKGDYEVTLFSPSPVATPETGTLTNATITVPLNGVPVASGPLNCTQWLATMNRGIRENLSALVGVCNGVAAEDDACVSFRAYIAAGAHLFDGPLPTNATCPQLDITPILSSETVQYVYYVPYTNGTQHSSGTSLNMVLGLVGYNKTRLCAYSRRADSLSDSYALYFPFALTAYPSDDLGDSQIDMVLVGSALTTYEDLGCDPRSAPYTHHFAPRAAGGASDQRACYTTEVEETSVGPTPVTGVDNSVLQRAFNMTPSDLRVFLGRLTSGGVDIDTCSSELLAAVFACHGAPPCVISGLAAALSGPSCGRVLQEKAGRVAVGYTDTTLRGFASKVLMYAGASVAIAAGAIVVLGALLATQHSTALVTVAHIKL